MDLFIILFRQEKEYNKMEEQEHELLDLSTVRPDATATPSSSSSTPVVEERSEKAEPARKKKKRHNEKVGRWMDGWMDG